MSRFELAARFVGDMDALCRLPEKLLSLELSHGNLNNRGGFKLMILSFEVGLCDFDLL